MNWNFTSGFHLGFKMICWQNVGYVLSQNCLVCKKKLEIFFFAMVTPSSIISDTPIISNNCFPLAQWNINFHKDLDFGFNSLHITPMDNILEINGFTTNHEYLLNFKTKHMLITSSNQIPCFI